MYTPFLVIRRIFLVWSAAHTLFHTRGGVESERANPHTVIAVYIILYEAVSGKALFSERNCDTHKKGYAHKYPEL